jgi:hypothetical protein
MWHETWLIGPVSTCRRASALDTLRRNGDILKPDAKLRKRNGPC